MGNGPIKLHLEIYRAGRYGPPRLGGDRRAGPRHGELPAEREDVQDVHRRLPHHGLRPATDVQRRLLRSLRGQPARGDRRPAGIPGRTGQPAAADGPPVRRPAGDVLEAHRRLQRRRQLRHLAEPGVRRDGLRGERLPDARDPLRRHPRSAGRRRPRRPLLVAAVPNRSRRISGGLLPAHYQRVHSTRADTGGAGEFRGGHGITKVYTFEENGAITFQDDRAHTYPWGSTAGNTHRPAKTTRPDRRDRGGTPLQSRKRRRFGRRQTDLPDRRRRRTGRSA